MKFTPFLLLCSCLFASISVARDHKKSRSRDRAHKKEQYIDDTSYLKEIFEVIASLSNNEQTRVQVTQTGKNTTDQIHNRLIEHIKNLQLLLEKNGTKMTEAQLAALNELLAKYTLTLNRQPSEQTKSCCTSQSSCCPTYVTSANSAACANALAKFNGASTGSIINAPLTSPNVSGIQATSAVLADDCVTTNLNLALTPKGTGALTAGIPDGTPVGGNARGNYAVDFQLQRSDPTQVASGPGSTIGGGGSNIANGLGATIAGGALNVASNASTVGGGQFNVAEGDYATIGGGFFNGAEGTFATTGGGGVNFAYGNESTIGGGSGNVTFGASATIPGGFTNRAYGDFSFAAGLTAIATHTGSFVWADSTGAPSGTTPFGSSANDQFNVRASGGTNIYSAPDLSAGVTLAPGGGAWVTVSDYRLKDNRQDIDQVEILNRLMNIPVQSWNYKSQDASIRHIGPMAQDFNPAFGFTESPLGISSIDCDGVALAAIQGLYKLYNQELQKSHEQRINHDQRINQLECIIQKLIQQLTSK